MSDRRAIAILSTDWNKERDDFDEDLRDGVRVSFHAGANRRVRKFDPIGSKLGSDYKLLPVLGGFNDKEHRYFSVVPDRAENVFSGLIRVGLYELDEISTVKEFLVFEIFKVEI